MDSLVIQDAVVTLVAGGALVLLVQRIVGLVSSKPRHTSCGGCSSCATTAPPGVSPPETRDEDGRRLIPMRRV